MNNGRVGRSLCVFELHVAGDWRKFFFLKIKKSGVPSRNLVPMGQPLLFDPSAIHLGSITAVEILHSKSAALAA